MGTCLSKIVQRFCQTLIQTIEHCEPPGFFTIQINIKNLYWYTWRKKSDYNSKNTGHAFLAGFVIAILVKNPYILSRDLPSCLKSTKFHAFRAVVPCEHCPKFALLNLQETHPTHISVWVLLQNEMLGHAYFRT